MQDWNLVIIPLVVFAVAMIAMFWLRLFLSRSLQRWFNSTKWGGGKIILAAMRIPSIAWAIIISAYLGMVVSSTPLDWKDLATRILWTIFIAFVTLAVVNALSDLIIFYGRRMQMPWQAARVLRNLTRIIFPIVGILGILELWGISTTPVLLLIAILALVAGLIFRDAAPNLFAGLQIGATHQIKVGDYIKLDGGAEGYVTAIRWNNTRIQTLDGSSTLIPNSRLLQRTVINYGRPLKKAREPFHFNDRTHLTELTGLKAKNLQDVVDILKSAPDSMVYFHTHHFIEERQYISPEPSNDFAVWVTDSLGHEILGERLASIDAFEFKSLETLKQRIIQLIEEYLQYRPNYREAMPGREFHFMKSVVVILPTRYVATDLREFVEALNKISLGSLYFHILESKLRLGKGLNDFSAWIETSVGDTALADEIARIDPYTYTLEGLRSSLTQLIENHIK